MIGSHPHQLCNRINTVIPALLYILKQFFLGHILAVKLLHMNMILVILEGTDGFQQTFLKGTSDTHNLTGCLHLGAQYIGSIRKFVKRETGHLRNHIVKSRFEAGRCIGKLDFIQIHTNRNLC